MLKSSSASKTPGHGCSDLRTTVYLSVASTDVIGRNVATQTPPFSLLSPVARFRFHTMSSAVNSRPVWNWTPLPQVQLQLLAVAAPVEGFREARLRHEFLILLQQAIPDAEQALAAAAEILPVEREQVAESAEPQRTPARGCSAPSALARRTSQPRRRTERLPRSGWRVAGGSTGSQRPRRATEPQKTDCASRRFSRMRHVNAPLQCQILARSADVDLVRTWCDGPAVSVCQ